MAAMPYGVVFIAASLMTALFVAATPPAIVTTAGYLNSDSERVHTAGWIEVLFGVRFDEDERRCAAEDKIFFRPMNECFRLFHRGPCQRREWLVFDKETAAAGKLTAVCKRRECAPKWGYDVRTNKCFDQSQCVSPTAFHYTLFGEGECRCNGTTAPGTGDPTCRELFRGGSCPAGMILAPRYRLIEGIDSTCTSDPCLEGAPIPGSQNETTPSQKTPLPEIVSTESSSFDLPKTEMPAPTQPEPASDLIVHPKDDSHLGSFALSWPQPPVAGPFPFNMQGRRNAPAVREPCETVSPDRGPEPGIPNDGISFPRIRGSSLESEVDPNSEVEVFSRPAAPTFHVRTTTRAVFDSGSNVRRSTYRTRDTSPHGYVYRHNHNTHNHGINRWSYYPEHYVQVRSGYHRVQRSVITPHDSRATRAEAAPRVDTGSHHVHHHSAFPRNAEGTFERAIPTANELSSTNRVVNPFFPSPPTNVLISTTNPITRNAANPFIFPRRVLNTLLPMSDDAKPNLSSRSDVGDPKYDHGINPLSVSASVTNSTGPDVTGENEEVDVRLSVQFPDGTSMCHTPAQLNVTCELRMVPLFSDLSDVKVPLCVNTLLRFALGRVGKSDECAENDYGVCAKHVVVKSSDPFDWDLE